MGCEAIGLAAKTLGIHDSDLEEISCSSALRWLAEALAVGEEIGVFNVEGCYVIVLEERPNPIAIVSCVDGETYCYEVVW